MHFTLFHATGSLPATFIWEFWAIQCLHTKHSAPVSCTINRIFWLLCFCSVHCNIIMQNEPMKCALLQINTLIQCFNCWCLLHVSNRPENEPMRFKTFRRGQKLKNWIKVLNWKYAFRWFMLHKNILTLWPKKTDFPLFDPYQPTVGW